MPLLKEINLNRKNFKIYDFTGTVVSEKTWHETKISSKGGNGGGFLYKGTGFLRTRPVKISNTTTIHHEFILQNRVGKERSFKFENLNLSCRESNIMSITWGVKKGKKEGRYWWIYNHNSGKIFPTKNYSKVFESPFWMKTLAFLSGLFVSGYFSLPWYMYLVLPILAGLVYHMIYYSLQGNMSLAKFETTDEFKALLKLSNIEAKKIFDQSNQQRARNAANSA